MKPTPKPLARPSFAYNHASLRRRLQIVEQVLEKCKSSASVSPADPFVTELREQASELARVEASVANLKKQHAAQIAVRGVKELGFRQQCMAFLGHIDTIARGDPAIITDVGLVPYTPEARVPTAMTPPLMRPAERGAAPGEVRLCWKAVKAARSYVIERSGPTGEEFVQVGISTGRRVTLTHQPSAARLHYRVAAVGPLGPGPFSDDVGMVPG